MTEQNTQKPNPSDKKPFSFIKSAVKATEEVIQADCRKRKKKIIRGHELRVLAIQRLRSSSQNGPDSHLGTAEARS